MDYPLSKRISTVFLPVSDIRKARDWYCDLLQIPADGEILFDHLYVLPTEGTRLVLDQKLFEKRQAGEAPLFHFDTTDIQAAYQLMKEKGIEITSDIEHDHWFLFRDPDGNSLMVCKC